MALKKVVGKVEEDLGGAVMFADDVEAIAEIVQRAADPTEEGLRNWEKEERTVSIDVPGYELGPSEIDQLPKRPKQLSIRLGSPDVWIFFTVFGVHAQALDTVEGQGVVTQVRKYLDEHCRPLLYAFSKSFTRLLVASVLTGSVLGTSLGVALRPLSPYAPAIGVLFGVVTWLATLIGLFAPRRAIVHNMRRKGHEPWWKQYRDKIVPQVITSIIVTTITLPMGILLGRACQRDAAAPAVVASAVPAAANDADSGPVDATTDP